MQEIVQFVQFYFIASGTTHITGLSELLQIGAANADALNMWNTLGASGAVYAILLAFGMIFPEARLFIFPLPIEMLPDLTPSSTMNTSLTLLIRLRIELISIGLTTERFIHIPNTPSALALSTASSTLNETLP